jgi:hypothetical protein
VDLLCFLQEGNVRVDILHDLMDLLRNRQNLTFCYVLHLALEIVVKSVVWSMAPPSSSRDNLIQASTEKLTDIVVASSSDIAVVGFMDSAQNFVIERAIALRVAIAVSGGRLEQGERTSNMLSN